MLILLVGKCKETVLVLLLMSVTVATKATRPRLVLGWFTVREDTRAVILCPFVGVDLNLPGQDVKLHPHFHCHW